MKKFICFTFLWAIFCVSCSNEEVQLKKQYCGDGLKNAQEQCDDGNKNDYDGCLTSCKLNICGDKFVNSKVEECDDANKDNQDNCLNTCKKSTCGDGFVNRETELCDTGKTLEENCAYGVKFCKVCASDCEFKEGKTSFCGDGKLDKAGGEKCDDGNNKDGDYCSFDCKNETGYCGDGVVQKIEVCDDGNNKDDDYCSKDCKTDLGKCGDKQVQKNESCDDGNTMDGDYCSKDCKKISGKCGDGQLQKSVETCDDGNNEDGDYCSKDCLKKTGSCGDKKVQKGEQCDDGNQKDGDYCSKDCKKLTGICGDGKMQNNEKCDDGNNKDGDYCSKDCLTITGVCGDKKIQTNEKCDDGNQKDGDYCSKDCKTITGKCGDKKVQSNETCDDGNTKDGDGCSANCQKKAIGVCGNKILEGKEACDDGNTVPANNKDDFCSADCLKNTWPCGEHPKYFNKVENWYWSSRTQPWTSFKKTTINGYDYKLIGKVNAGSQVSFKSNLTVNGSRTSCPGCIYQHYLSFWTEDKNNKDPKANIISNYPKCFTSSRSVNSNIAAPTQPGTYYVRWGWSWHFSCQKNWYNMTPPLENSFAAICIPGCGNGKLDPGEKCDDGNTKDGDYCSKDCQTKTGACGDKVKQSNEACDDGNTKPNDEKTDYCSADCKTNTWPCGEHPGYIKKPYKGSWIEIEQQKIAGVQTLLSVQKPKASFKVEGKFTYDNPKSGCPNCVTQVYWGLRAKDTTYKSEKEAYKHQGCVQYARYAKNKAYNYNFKAPKKGGTYFLRWARTWDYVCKDPDMSTSSSSNLGAVCVFGCGDGVKSKGEACDDGNNLDGDKCSADCSKVLP